MHSHYSTPPFHSLPPSVTDDIFRGLTVLSLHQCALVCKAWRHLPYTYLYQLSVGEYGIKLPINLLHLCSNLRSIQVASSSTPMWLPLARHISQQQLPSLQELHIQHSSHSSSELQQLKQILQVQGPSCHLYLALTDKSSLQSLVELLPIPGLAQLDLNVPYLPEGAADLLAQAVELQALSSTTQQQWLQAKPLGVGSQQGQLQQQPQQLKQNAHQEMPQQHAFSMGVWICCWGGCPGLELRDAQTIYQRLQSLGCIMHGCESINCRSSDDVEQLAAFKGVKALGVCYKGSSSGRGSSGGSITRSAVQSAGSGHERSVLETTSSSDTSSSSSSRKTMWDANTAALAGLAGLVDSLQQLTVHGCPVGGFSSSVAATAAAGGSTICDQRANSRLPKDNATQQQLPPSLHPLAALTGLTKLALLKQWGPQPPLPISPISLLTGLRELAIERQVLASPFELCCLSVLTGVKVLSLSLSMQAEQLVEEVENGEWQTVDMGVGQGYEGQLASHTAMQTQQQQEEAALEAGLPSQVAALTMCADVVEDACMTDQQLPIGDSSAAVTPAAAAGISRCSCFCSFSSTAQEPAEPGATDACTSNKQSTASDPTEDNAATAAAGVEPAELLRQLSCCSAGAVSSAILLDWGWLSRLTQLEVAWLQVPHLDLACLPDSMIELDAQQLHDLEQVSITCCGATTSNKTSSGGFSSGRVWLPNLRRLVLPCTSPVMSLQPSAGCAAASDPIYRCSIPAAERSCTGLTPEQHLSAEDGATVSDSSDEWDHGSNSTISHDMDTSDACNALMQLHHSARLLLQLSQGCPELRDLELVQWQLPLEAVVSAAQHLRHLRLISFSRSEELGVSDLMQQGLATVRGGNVALKFILQEPLVLSRYPWSSVLAER